MGSPEAALAQQTLDPLNPTVEVVGREKRLGSTNATCSFAGRDGVVGDRGNRPPITLSTISVSGRAARRGRCAWATHALMKPTPPARATALGASILTLPCSRFAGEGMEAAGVLGSVPLTCAERHSAAGRAQWLCPAVAANGSNLACAAGCPATVADTIAFRPGCGT